MNMNRRATVAGALATLVAMIVPARADVTFVINNWTKGERIPQIVRRSEIRECDLINIDPDHTWIEIVTRDGRRISSELSRFQDVPALLRQLVEAGVPVNDHDRPRQRIAGGGYGYVRDNGTVDRVRLA